MKTPNVDISAYVLSAFQRHVIKAVSKSYVISEYILHFYTSITYIHKNFVIFAWHKVSCTSTFSLHQNKTCD